MSVTCIVQARMGSTRLPGKVLVDLGGLPMLAFMLRRVVTAPVENVVVATTNCPLDDPVVDLVRTEGLPVVRGPEEDVLARFILALDHYPADHVVRLTADCPLADPAIIADAINLHLATQADYTSNTLVRTFPDGLDVEVVRSDVLRIASREARSPEEREHVTPFVQRHPERFRLAVLAIAEDLGEERWTVDAEEDLSFVRSVVGQLQDPQAGWQEVHAVAGHRHRKLTDEVRLRSIADDIVCPASGRHRRSMSRSWIAEVNREPKGWLAITVSDAIGRLCFAMPAGHLVPTIQSLQRCLLRDYQVREVRASAGGRSVVSRAFHECNFAYLGRDRWSWIRLDSSR